MHMLLLCFFMATSLSIEAQVTLNAPTGGNNYQWYADGVAIPSETNNSYTATAAGTYYAVFDGASCAQSTDVFVLVDNCTDGESVTLNLTLPDGDEIVSWSSGGSSTSETITSTNTPTTYTATVSSDGGQCESSYSFTVQNVGDCCPTPNCFGITIQQN